MENVRQADSGCMTSSSRMGKTMIA